MQISFRGPPPLQVSLTLYSQPKLHMSPHLLPYLLYTQLGLSLAIQLHLLCCLSQGAAKDMSCNRTEQISRLADRCCTSSVLQMSNLHPECTTICQSKRRCDGRGKSALHRSSGASRAPCQACPGMQASWQRRWGWARRWRCWPSCLRIASRGRIRRAAANDPAQYFSCITNLGQKQTTAYAIRTATSLCVPASRHQASLIPDLSRHTRQPAHTIGKHLATNTSSHAALHRF